MKIIPRLFLFLAFYLLFGSCSHGGGDNVKTESAPNREPALATADSNGRIFSNLYCHSDPSVHYSLYLPQGYTASKDHPLFLLFDPHGDAIQPLELYRALADRYGLVLMASVESKNGIDAALSGTILQALDYECMHIPRVDTNLLHCGGFSGGARVAAMLAMGSRRFKGLMLAGAGFPSANWTGVPPHIVVGYAGQKDMNLMELRELKPEKKLESRYQFISALSTHAWPSESAMEKVLIAFLSTAMRDGYGNKNDTLIPLAAARYRKLISESRAESTPLLLAYDYLNYLRCFEGLIKVNEEEKAYGAIQSDPSYRNAIEAEVGLRREETETVQGFTSAIMQKPVDWWQGAMRSWMDTTSFAKDKARVAMHVRVRDKLSLIAYSSLNRAIQSGKPDQCRYFSSLYLAVDPGNSEAWYLAAIVFAREGQMGQALESLETALDRGFTDRQRMESEVAFRPIQTDNRYQSLLNRIH